MNMKDTWSKSIRITIKKLVVILKYLIDLGQNWFSHIMLEGSGAALK
jgi:hypothetical protein